MPTCHTIIYEILWSQANSSRRTWYVYWCNAGCCCHGGRIRAICDGESHSEITELWRCVVKMMSSPSLFHLSSRWTDDLALHSWRAWRKHDLVDHNSSVRLHWCCTSTDMVLLQGCFMRYRFCRPGLSARQNDYSVVLSSLGLLKITRQSYWSDEIWCRW